MHSKLFGAVHLPLLYPKTATIDSRWWSVKLEVGYLRLPRAEHGELSKRNDDRHRKRMSIRLFVHSPTESYVSVAPLHMVRVIRRL